MSRINYTPYNINIPYELKTYKNVGKDYGNSKDANKGWLLNIGRFYRKRKNRKEDEYKFCNTYSDWEEHIKKIINTDLCNYNDMIHWIKLKRNNAELYLESVKSVLIPVYIAVITIDENYLSQVIPKDIKFGALIFMLLIVTIFSVIFLYEAAEKVNFYDDFIRIAEKIDNSISYDS